MLSSEVLLTQKLAFRCHKPGIHAASLVRAGGDAAGVTRWLCANSAHDEIEILVSERTHRSRKRTLRGDEVQAGDPCPLDVPRAHGVQARIPRLVTAAKFGTHRDRFLEVVLLSSLAQSIGRVFVKA
jgi:hypothetical protein